MKQCFATNCYKAVVITVVIIFPPVKYKSLVCLNIMLLEQSKLPLWQIIVASFFGEKETNTSETKKQPKAYFFVIFLG